MIATSNKNVNEFFIFNFYLFILSHLLINCITHITYHIHMCDSFLSLFLQSPSKFYYRAGNICKRCKFQAFAFTWRQFFLSGIQKMFCQIFFFLTLFIQYLKKIAKMSFQNINGSIWKSSNTNLHNILHTNEKNAQKWKFNKHFHKKSCTTFYSYSQISHENYNKIHWKME